MATKAVFKPLSYLTACTILSTDKETLRQQENDVKNKKKLAVELFYKVYLGIGAKSSIFTLGFIFVSCSL